MISIDTISIDTNHDLPVVTRDVLIRSTDGLSQGAGILVREHDMNVSAALRYAERVARTAEMTGSPLLHHYSAVAAELRAVIRGAQQGSRDVA